jgi:hypothetical protein
VSPRCTNTVVYLGVFLWKLKIAVLVVPLVLRKSLGQCEEIMRNKMRMFSEKLGIR